MSVMRQNTETDRVSNNVWGGVFQTAGPGPLLSYNMNLVAGNQILENKCPREYS